MMGSLVVDLPRKMLIRICVVTSRIQGQRERIVIELDSKTRIERSVYCRMGVYDYLLQVQYIH
jgi:hypothetical protein